LQYERREASGQGNRRRAVDRREGKMRDTGPLSRKADCKFTFSTGESQ
jgi:hypothetical protein